MGTSQFGLPRTRIRRVRKTPGADGLAAGIKPPRLLPSPNTALHPGLVAPIASASSGFMDRRDEMSGLAVDLAALGLHLDLMIFKVFSSLNDSRIP